MNVLTKTGHILHILHWRLTWNRRDTRKAYTVPDNPKFMNARDAVKRIRPGSVVAVAGLAGNQRASILYWALRELYEETGLWPVRLVRLLDLHEPGRRIRYFWAEGLHGRLLSSHEGEAAWVSFRQVRRGPYGWMAEQALVASPAGAQLVV